MVLAFFFKFFFLGCWLVGLLEVLGCLFVCWGVVRLFVCFVLVYLSRFDLDVVN